MHGRQLYIVQCTVYSACTVQCTVHVQCSVQCTAVQLYVEGALGVLITPLKFLSGRFCTNFMQRDEHRHEGWGPGSQHEGKSYGRLHDYGTYIMEIVRLKIFSI